ncbi:hypothetical protein GUITHDRAFT_137545 [Guillardia theta CCMP2712]|uniref:Uncharacterized protein n=1 Tax=Guillardia theta (strain CCMP2712) TaxID=905079 RepID=L1JFT0_GUITC|nr:hypothetical protein GUITHDRAFT_137545 [Guillardia theta CCMP2712]EKX47368.1 hypothetical protein GUITHDRAFT_137545 [Guillardia theta CCMP2712]|eukprot:XP_005834348.1 hypothetical protein GUITHDRAFT_137545 [Guillardia theta CCMP2712]
MVQKASHDAIRLNHLFKEMRRSIESSAHSAEHLSEQDETAQRLVDFLQIAGKRSFVRGQVEELEKNIQSAQHEIEVIMQSVSIVETRQLDGVLRGIEDNTSVLFATTSAMKSTSLSVKAIQIILLVLLVFNLIDRIGGGSLNVPAPTWVIDLIKKPLMDPPFLWFIVNVALAAIITYLANYWERVSLQRHQKQMACELHCRAPILDLNKLERRLPFLNQRSNFDLDSVSCMVRWKEPITADLWKWGGAPPEIQITYDKKRMLLLSISLWVDRHYNSSSEQHLVKSFLQARRGIGIVKTFLTPLLTLVEHEILSPTHQDVILAPYQQEEKEEQGEENQEEEEHEEDGVPKIVEDKGAEEDGDVAL